MKKQFQLFRNAMIISYIIFSYGSLKRINNGEYIQNYYFKISDNYHLWQPDNRYQIFDLGFGIEKPDQFKNIGDCENIKKITLFNLEYNEYIIGYLSGEKQHSDNEKLCKGYFYINRQSDNKAKFNLSEKEIEEKFNKKIEYDDISNFMKYNGEGSNTKKNIEEIISVNTIFGVLSVIPIYLILNILLCIRKLLKK